MGAEWMFEGPPAEASRGAGGRSDCTLWMEMWALDPRPQFVTALDPGLTGQSV